MNRNPRFSFRASRHVAVMGCTLIGFIATTIGAGCQEKKAAAGAAPQVPATIPATADGSALFNAVCMACHGPNGEGNEQIKSPSIAGLPAWYMTTQMSNFREGRRGHDPKDVPGLLMSAVAKMLKPEQIKALAAHVEAMPGIMPKPVVQSDQVDLENGMLLWQERCMECHRYNASGELAFGSPPLTGRQDWYLAAQIQKFKNGQRGTIKGDVNGAKMVLSSQFIEDEQSLKDVIAYIMTLNTDATAGAGDLFSQPGTGQRVESKLAEQSSK